jgi:hypothetical protein
MMLMTVACSLANRACKQLKNVGHVSLQTAMSGPALAQECSLREQYVCVLLQLTHHN